MEHADIFILLAELAIAFAGFASVVVVFRERERRSWSAVEFGNFRAMLRNSLGGGLFAVLPFPLAAFGLDAAPLWSLLSGLLAAHLCRSAYFLVTVLRDSDRNAKSLPVISSALGLLTVLAFQVANIPTNTAFHGAAPYLAGVCWVLLTAGFSFYNLVMPAVRESRAVAKETA